MLPFQTDRSAMSFAGLRLNRVDFLLRNNHELVVAMLVAFDDLVLVYDLIARLAMLLMADRSSACFAVQLIERDLLRGFDCGVNLDRNGDK